MKKLKKKGGLWNYLRENGLEDCTNEVLLDEAKKQYWKVYDKELKHRIRNKEKRTCTVSFPKDDISKIRKYATGAGYTLAELIKQSVYATLENTYVIPNLYGYKEILKELHSCKHILSNLQEKDKGIWGSFGNYEKATQLLIELKQSIHKSMYQAEPIETHLKRILENNPSYATHIKQLIQQFYDSKEFEQKN